LGIYLQILQLDATPNETLRAATSLRCKTLAKVPHATP